MLRILSRKLGWISLCLVVFSIIFNLYSPTPATSSPDCPSHSSNVPVISWLVTGLDYVTVHRYITVNDALTEVQGYPKNSTDPNFINALLNLTGSFVKWNGYASASPFGTFYYPRWGNWYAQFELHTGLNVYNVWMWRSSRYNANRVLVFTFKDMIQNKDNNGEHDGQHDFCISSVRLSVLNQIEKLLP